MALPEVFQAQVLSKLFASALAEYIPESLAVFGCTTGNGFEHIDISQTKRIVGLDINPEYLEILKNRFESKIPCLQTIEADFTISGFQIEPVSMVFAGLLFEYVSIRTALASIERCMLPRAMLVVVFQLPSTESAPVTPTQYKSLELLTPLMRLVSLEEFSNACMSIGIHEVKKETVPLKKGKAFHVGYFRKNAEPTGQPDGKGLHFFKGEAL